MMQVYNPELLELMVDTSMSKVAYECHVVLPSEHDWNDPMLVLSTRKPFGLIHFPCPQDVLRADWQTSFVIESSLSLTRIAVLFCTLPRNVCSICMPTPIHV